METEKFSGGSCSQERGSELVAMWKGHVQSREVSDNAADHPLYARTTTHNDATTHTNFIFSKFNKFRYAGQRFSAVD